MYIIDMSYIFAIKNLKIKYYFSYIQFRKHTLFFCNKRAKRLGRNSWYPGSRDAKHFLPYRQF